MTGPRQDLVLAGPMAVGKTTTGRILGRVLDRTFSDLDERIEAREGRSVAELFAAGEPVFRAAEAAAARAWLERPGDAPPEVLALGGGTLQNAELAEALLRRAILVHIDAPANVLAGRLRPADLRVRPLVVRAPNLLETLVELRRARAEGYARADLAVSSALRTPDEAAVAILRELYDPDAGPWRAEPRPIGDDPAFANVTAGRGALPFPATPRAALLWDRCLPDAHASYLLPRLASRASGQLVDVSRAGGEGAKTPASLVEAWSELLRAGVDRDTPLWVAGGGTLTDLGGLLAHTFKRGLPLHLLPTTLLAQLDAALGGKNGINLDRTKNAVGTVRLPAAVHIDPLFLLTIPPVDLRGGLAEAVKSGLIGDPGLVDRIESGVEALAGRGLDLLEEVAARSAAVKLAIVGRDLEEQGERRVLNLGHTLGHAIEAATAHRPDAVPHGDAVAIGTVFAARLSRRLGVLQDDALPDRIETLLAALGLPVRVPELSPDEEGSLFAALSRDKKRFRGENVWVLPVAAGRIALRAVGAEDAARAIEEFRR